MEYTIRTRHIHSCKSYCGILLAVDITMCLPCSHGSTITGLPEMYKWKFAEKTESSWSPVKHRSRPCSHFIYLPIRQRGKWPQYRASGPKTPLSSLSLLASALPGRKWGQRHWLGLWSLWDEVRESAMEKYGFIYLDKKDALDSGY